MRTRIKICGLRDAAMARAAALAGADAVGLVFAAKSPRAVSTSAARAVVAGLPALVEAVGVFVNEALDTVRGIAAETGLGAVQLHGDESPTYAAALAPMRVIRAMPLVDAEAMAGTLAAWRRDRPENLAALLIDAPPPPPPPSPPVPRSESALSASSLSSPGSTATITGAMTGGFGETCDWGLLRGLMDEGAFDGLPPVILAGGLTPGNVGEAIRSVGPYAVDVSSGVERSRGVKDVTLIQQFCERTRMGESS